jgi:UDP-N-acetylmuramoyl-L-alanyl-D-glutamate--2,6-diaminopimelate ligase
MASFKERRLVKFFYNFPGALSAYHFLWAWTGAATYRFPSKKLFVIGVTGTKGKTTTLEIINAILEAGGKRTALLSSLRVKIGDATAKNKTGNSMPGRAYIQNFLRRAARAKCDYALIEVTSQGVVLHRHRFIKWQMGVLTNLAPEHIESHGSFENYRNAKLSFLQYVFREGGEVFLNRDDKEFRFFFDTLISYKPKEYSKEDEFLKNCLPRIRAARKEGEVSSTGETGSSRAPRGRFLLSDFNEENIAVAAAIGRRLGIDDAIIEKAILNFEGVPGRMEFVTGGGYTAVVDYAHTPDSLEAAYKAVKPKPSAEYPEPKLIALLGGAGGGRDKWKRPAMGAIAVKYCDEIILTNEDPYNEDPWEILNEIERGIREADSEKATRIYKILDRKEAIKKAFEIAKVGDVIIGTGKGSEEWIRVEGGKKVPWNERAFFEEALQEEVAKKS